MQLGFELWIGDPAEIKAKRVKKQKTLLCNHLEANSPLFQRFLFCFVRCMEYDKDLSQAVETA